MVVEKYRSGMTKAQIIRQFGISASTLYLWKLKHKTKMALSVLI